MFYSMAINAVRRAERISGETCAYWLAGRCNRNPCRFLHGGVASRSTTHPYATTAHRYLKQSQSIPEKTPLFNSKKVPVKKSGGGGSTHKSTQKSSPSICKSGGGASTPKSTQKLSPSICKYWMNGNCVHGDKCRNLHSWCSGDGFSTLAKLKEHKKVITGIALPFESDKLYTCSTDGEVCLWDCHSGQCVNKTNLGGEIRSLISEGPWVFAGLVNTVKAWNIQTGDEFILDGPKGLVHAMVTGNDTLFAGGQDGVISAWRGSSDSQSPLELVASMSGHTRAVVCLAVGGKRLYSGSMDHTIKVWDLDTLQCIMTLNGHAGVVMSLICWDQFLLSSSLDSTVKVWAATEEGPLEVIYTHQEGNGVLALCGMTDAEGKPILFCSCYDNSVRLYELPSFSERGRLFAKQEVRTIEVGPGGLFFTGDGTGLVTAWKWLQEPKVEVESSMEI